MHEVESMMYAKRLPWHGLGHYVGNEPILSEDAIIAAGLDWTVGAYPLYTMFKPERAIEVEEIIVPERFAVVRETDGSVLACGVSPQYKAIQNHEAFTFMDTLAGPGNLIRYHTAGSLRGGQKVFLLATVEGLSFEPVKNDRTDMYLCLMTGHDGKTPLVVFWTSVRVVCMNTARLALSKANKQDMIKVRHRKNATQNLKEAQKILGLTTERFEETKELYTFLAEKSISVAQVDSIMDDLFPFPEEEGRAYTIAENKRDLLSTLLDNGLGTDIPGVKGSAYWVYNALTEFTSHHQQVRVGLPEEDSRYNAKRTERLLESNWFGTGATLQDRAVRALVAV